jgi:hypothetical protein
MTPEERNQKIELYGRGFDLLIAALKNVPIGAMKFKPEPKEWSVHEIVVHIADSEANAALRARKLIVEPGGTLMAYDQDKWAVNLNYHDQSMEDALETTRLVRKTTYALLKTVSVHVFETHTLNHPEMPDVQYTLDRWLNIYSNHIPGHIEQIQNNVTLWRQGQK